MNYRQLFALTVIGVLGVGYTSCSSPDVRVQQKPVKGSPSASLSSLSGLTQKTLKDQGSDAPFRKDPDAALRSLEQSYRTDGGEERLLSLAQLCLSLGAKQEKTGSDASVGYYLDAARLSAPAALRYGSAESDRELRLIYNEACASVASLMYKTTKGQRGAVSGIKGPLGTYRLTIAEPSRGSVPLDKAEELISADHIEFEKLGITRLRQDGVGGAMVGYRSRPNLGSEEAFASSAGLALPVNAIVEFSKDGSEATLVHRNLMKVDQIAVGGRQISLNADWSAPIGYLYRFLPPSKIGFSGMLKPAKFDSETNIHELGSFDPDKVPVVFVHGLLSSPMTWTEMINQLWADPVIRKNYQALVFRYPSGYPIARNAGALRASLEEFRKAHETPQNRQTMRRTVLVGHSMGGILSNIQIRESGETLRELVFQRPIEEMDLSEDAKENLRNLLVFHPDPYVERAVFIAAPHRGSEIASNWIGNLGTSLIKLPSNLLSTGLSSRVIEKLPNLTDLGKREFKTKQNSIHSLHPDSAFLKTVMELPVAKRVKFHTIAGQVNQDAPVAEGTDTWVPYWSSHVDGAESELIVDASHTTITPAPDAIAEVRRILYLHVGKKPAGPLAGLELLRRAAEGEGEGEGKSRRRIGARKPH